MPNSRLTSSVTRSWVLDSRICTVSRGQTSLFGKWRLAFGWDMVKAGVGRTREGRVQSERNLFGSPESGWRGERIEVGR